MSDKKITMMHSLFGRLPGKHCRECENLRWKQAGGRRAFKCQVYGETSSEATDWALKNEACGMFNKVWTDKPVMRLNAPKQEEAVQIEGQIGMEEYMA